MCATSGALPGTLDVGSREPTRSCNTVRQSSAEVSLSSIEETSLPAFSTMRSDSFTSLALLMARLLAAPSRSETWYVSSTLLPFWYAFLASRAVFALILFFLSTRASPRYSARACCRATGGSDAGGAEPAERAAHGDGFAPPSRPRGGHRPHVSPPRRS